MNRRLILIATLGSLTMLVPNLRGQQSRSSSLKEAQVILTAVRMPPSPGLTVAPIKENKAKDRVAATLNLQGSNWEIKGYSFGLRIVEFGEDNKVTGRFNVEASRGEGTWTQAGPNSISGNFGSFGAFTATVSGSEMTVTRSGGTVHLFRK